MDAQRINGKALSRASGVSYDVIMKLRHRPESSTSVENGQALLAALGMEDAPPPPNLPVSLDSVRQAVRILWQNIPADQLARMSPDDASEVVASAIEMLVEPESDEASVGKVIQLYARRLAS